MNIEKGQRKLSANKRSASYLLLGLALTLVCTGFFKIDAVAASGIYFSFCIGIVGKDGALAYGNAKEHEAAANKPTQ